MTNSKIIALSVLGLLAGLLLGAALFDTGPGLEPGVIVTALIGAATPALLARRDDPASG